MVLRQRTDTLVRLRLLQVKAMNEALEAENSILSKNRTEANDAVTGLEEMKERHAKRSAEFAQMKEQNDKM